MYYVIYYHNFIIVVLSSYHRSRILYFHGKQSLRKHKSAYSVNQSKCPNSWMMGIVFLQYMLLHNHQDHQLCPSPINVLLGSSCHFWLSSSPVQCSDLFHPKAKIWLKFLLADTKSRPAVHIHHLTISQRFHTAFTYWSRVRCL